MSEPTIRLAPSNKAVEAAFQDLQSWGATQGETAEDGVKSIIAATPEVLSHKVELEVTGADGQVHMVTTHAYAMFLQKRNFSAAGFIEQSVAGDPKTKGLLAEIYNTPSPEGLPPIYYQVQGRNWKAVKAMLDMGVSPENLDDKGNNILHLLARQDAAPEVFTQLLKDMPKEELQKMAAKTNADGFTPYHMVRTNDTLTGLIALDEGKGLGIPLAKEGSLVTPVLALFEHKNCVDLYSAPIPYGETLKMAITLFEKKACVGEAASQAYRLEHYLRHGEEDDENADNRLKLLRLIYAHNAERTVPNGEFESNYLQQAATLPDPDKAAVRRVIETGATNVNAITYKEDGSIASNLLYDAVLSRPDNVDFLLNLKAGPDLKVDKNFKINPNPALFAISHIDSNPKSDYDTYQAQIRMADALNHAGVKATRDKAGMTPIMIAMDDLNIGLVSYFIRNGMVSERPKAEGPLGFFQRIGMIEDKKKVDEIAELRNHLDKLSDRFNGAPAVEKIKQMREMLDAYEKGREQGIPDYAPPKPVPERARPPVVFASLTGDEKWLSLAMKEADELPPASPVYAAMPSGKKTVLN